MNLAGIQGAIEKVTRYNDIMLAGLVVAIISLMILPLPTPIVDALIATNLTVAVTLLMLAIYIPSALSLSTFPTLLLFTTLFRLSLNITTTRTILINAYGGEIINTFGNFVVSGNFVVGGVIFLIITIVQFLVIAKGSERVAEVGARFTLDAMPGKQMSIDADLRAGVIDMAEAQRRRRNVEKESQLYGAMDGAMKFVKGDAIAGLIITAINILGGMTIGVLQKGMTVAKAVQTYSILTIGDGLVSQIPALFISITAGVITTRVSTDDSENLGSDIGAQVLGQPKALLVAGCIVLAFALVPGFPKPQFLLLGLVMGSVGYVLYRGAERRRAEEAGTAQGFVPAMKAAGSPKTPERPKEGEEFSVTVPLMIDVDARVQEVIDPQVLNDELIRIRRALYMDLGVPFPGINLRLNENISNGKYVILLQEIPASEGRLKPGYVLVREAPQNLEAIGIAYEEDVQFLPDVQTVWVSETQIDNLEAAGIAFFTPPKILTYHLSFVLQGHADDFIGIQETKFLLDRMEEGYSELVRETLRVMPIQKITEVFQRLVQEEISIRNLKVILQSLIEWGQKEKDVVLLVEYVRMGLRRYISYKYSGGQNILAAYLLDQTVEDVVRKAIRQTSGGSYLALEPATMQKIVDSLKAEVGDLSQGVKKPVLLTSMDIRRYMKKMIEQDFPSLPVLSYQELTPEITIQPLSKVTI